MNLDAHCDFLWKCTKHGLLSLQNGSKYSDLSFEKMREGQLDSAVFALYVSDAMQDELGPSRSLGIVGRQAEMAQQPGVRLVRTTTEARAAKAEGLFPVFLALEGGRLLQNSRLTLKKLVRKLGVKYITLTHNRNTEWADSATDKPNVEGVSEKGRDILLKMEELGVLVDVSHTSENTQIDVVEHATKPVIASHSGCAAVKDHVRNLHTWVLKKIAGSGGVVCIPFVRKFTGPTVLDVFKHIHYAAQEIGWEHVGIGSDVDGADLVDGWRDARDWHHVAADWLSAKQYTDEQIAGITGENMLRLFA